MQNDQFPCLIKQLIMLLMIFLIPFWLVIYFQTSDLNKLTQNVVLTWTDPETEEINIFMWYILKLFCKISTGACGQERSVKLNCRPFVRMNWFTKENTDNDLDLLVLEILFEEEQSAVVDFWILTRHIHFQVVAYHILCPYLKSFSKLK